MSLKLQFTLDETFPFQLGLLANEVKLNPKVGFGAIGYSLHLPFFLGTKSSIEK